MAIKGTKPKLTEPNSWGGWFEWDDMSRLVAFRIPLPFVQYYAITAYFRYRPYAYRSANDLERFVIDWPWVRYVGWYDGNGNKVPAPHVY